MNNPGLDLAAKEKKHFDRLADEIGEIWWGSKTPAGKSRYRRRAQLIKRRISVLSDPKVLEIGCGTGAFTEHVLNEIPDLAYTGCDISSKAIEISRNRFEQHRNACFDTANIMKLNYEDSAFDIILGNSVLHHLDLSASLNEIYRVLKNNGEIIFFEPNMINPQIFLEKNVRLIGKRLQNTEDETAFIRWSLSRQLKRIGFGEVKITPFDFMHPAIPERFISFTSILQNVFEKIPVLKEIGGSLIITATKYS